MNNSEDGFYGNSCGETVANIKNLTTTTSGGWEDWVRTLANSTNARDTELLVAKLKVLLTAQRTELVGRVESLRKILNETETGNSSFGNYSPTKTYTKALEHVITLLQK